MHYGRQDYAQLPLVSTIEARSDHISDFVSNTRQFESLYCAQSISSLPAHHRIKCELLFVMLNRVAELQFIPDWGKHMHWGLFLGCRAVHVHERQLHTCSCRACQRRGHNDSELVGMD